MILGIFFLGHSDGMTKPPGWNAPSSISLEFCPYLFALPIALGRAPRMAMPKVWGNPGRALELFFELSPRDQHSGGAGARTGCLPGVGQPVMSVLVKRSAEHLDLDEDETIDATPVDANGNAQRARTGSRHHPSEYKPGAVMKVRLHNFMTYSDVEMEPGPRLNVILGPNGTGKSSFVCALSSPSTPVCCGLTFELFGVGEAPLVRDWDLLRPPLRTVFSTPLFASSSSRRAGLDGRVPGPRALSGSSIRRG